MITLNGYIGFLQSIVEENKEFGEMPVAYSTDDEGNAYHLIHQQLTPCQVNDLEERYLDIHGYYDDTPDSDIKIEDVNCIIVN